MRTTQERVSSPHWMRVAVAVESGFQSEGVDVPLAGHGAVMVEFLAGSGFFVSTW